MTACTDFPSLLGLRFVLGSFESMIGISNSRILQLLLTPSALLRGYHSDVVAAERADAPNSIVEWNEWGDFHRKQDLMI